MSYLYICDIINAYKLAKSQSKRERERKREIIIYNFGILSVFFDNILLATKEMSVLYKNI